RIMMITEEMKKNLTIYRKLNIKNGKLRIKKRIQKFIVVILFNNKAIPIIPPSIIEFCTKNNSIAADANVAPIIKAIYLKTNWRLVIGLCCFFMDTHLFKN